MRSGVLVPGVLRFNRLIWGSLLMDALRARRTMLSLQFPYAMLRVRIYAVGVEALPLISLILILVPAPRPHRSLSSFTIVPFPATTHPCAVPCCHRADRGAEHVGRINAVARPHARDRCNSGRAESRTTSRDRRRPRSCSPDPQTADPHRSGP